MDGLELDALGQAQAIRNGGLDAAELCAAARQRLEDSDRDLNSVVWLRDEQEVADAAAQATSGPFAGVPLVLKDLPGWQQGFPVGLGVRALEEAHLPAPVDSPGGARLRAAGFVTLATTSTSPFGWGPWAATAAGHTRTPYDLTRASNGSGGGSAACVAVGAVAVGTGADAAGSIRLPAAWCGVVGHKATRGLVPSAWAHTQAVEGVNTRTVRDSAALLDVLAAPFPGSVFGLAPHPGGYLASLDRPLARLRVAVLDDFTEDTTPATREVLEQVGQRLAELGHDVRPATPPGLYEGDPERERGLALHALLAQSIDDASALLGRPLRADETEPYVGMMADLGRSATAQHELQRVAWVQSWAREFCRFWSSYDVFVCPTTAFAPQPVTDWQPNPDDPFEPWSRWGLALDYTEPFNRSGQPALSIPAVVVDGLPYGVQLVGRHGEDALLHQLGAALEQTTEPIWPLTSTGSAPERAV